MIRLHPLFAFVALFGFWVNAAAQQVQLIDNTMLEQLLADGVTVVDIRRADEWQQTGVLPGSHLMTFFDAKGKYDTKAWLAELEKIAKPEEPLVIICQAGQRSRVISRFLAGREGYKEVHDVPGGMGKWILEGRKTVPPTP